MPRTLFAVAIVLLAAVCLTGQTPPSRPASTSRPGSGSGLITGHVIDAATGSPLASVVVAIAPTGQQGPPSPQAGQRVLTDDSGRFFFSDLPAGTFTLTATKPGWLPGALGRRRPVGNSFPPIASIPPTPPIPLELRDGDRRGDLTIAMWRFAVVSGRVTDEEGEPLVGAEVRIFQQHFAAGRRQWTFIGRALTDDRGVYRFANLLPSDYLVVVPATVNSEPAALNAPGDTPRAYLQTMTAVGTAPMSLDRAQVPARGNESLLSSILSLPRPPSDDAVWSTYQTTFFPSTNAIGSATTVHAVAGRDRSGVDVVVRFTPTYQVSGVLTGPDGTPAALHAVHLLRSDSVDNPLFDVSTAVTDTAGGFTFYGVPPGQYVARVVRTPWPAGQGARLGVCGGTGAIHYICGVGGGPGAGPPPLSTEPLAYADQPVTVTDRHVRDIGIALRTGARVTGRAEFEGSAPRPTDAQWTNMTVLLELANGQSFQPAGGYDITQPGRFSADGQFTTPSAWPGRYLVRAAAPPGWVFKSATYQGRDISETPLDLTGDLTNVVITFTDRSAKIEGTVQGPDGQADAGSLVLLFPTDPAGWIDYGRTSRRVRSVSASAGKFTLPVPPEGQYFLIAIPDEQAADWQNPALLERISALADRVSVTEGQSLTHALRTKRVQ